MRHVLSALVQNVPGVLAHISGMLASRGYNIDSLAVGETEDPNLSRMTFVVVGDEPVMEARVVERTGDNDWQSETQFETCLEPLVHGSAPPGFSF